MTSNIMNTAEGNTQQETESPPVSVFFDSPLRKVPMQAQNSEDSAPLISFTTENQETDNKNQSPSEKALINRVRRFDTGGGGSSPSRRRFMSYSEPQTTEDEDNFSAFCVTRKIERADTQSFESKEGGNESPLFSNRSPTRIGSMRSTRLSRFRKRSYDSNDVPDRDFNISKELQGDLPVIPEKRKFPKLGAKANALLKKVTSPITKPSPKISLTFDAFVDKQKGVETIKSSYPTYKTDKRLIFLGKTFKYPTFVIPFKSNFRKFWEILIILIIIYEVFWHPLAVTFLYNQETPTGPWIFEWILYPIFLLDLLVNMKTTYSNENNEEIIDLKMIRKNYMKTHHFIVDTVSLIPLGEILYYSFPHSEWRNLLYSIPKLVRFLRLIKLDKYWQNLDLSNLFKLLKIFVSFFLMVHWMSCIWFLLIKFQHYESPEIDKIWYPNNLRMIVPEDEKLYRYYSDMDVPEIYAYTMLAVFMLVVGSDMAPVNQIQVYVTVVIGLIGAVSLAYVFGLVTYIINRRNESQTQYKQKLEALNQKLRINKVPENLRAKVLEYFNYTWRKHRILQKLNDFSELSIPLQRDLAFYQNQKIVTKVPLFQELEPLEILSIIQKLKTCVYMPGDKIIREGERGSEMYFIQEGVVEIVIKTSSSQPSEPQAAPTFRKIYLEKEAYFGEIALMSNSKRTSDANAFEFCILESFSRSDYNNLKKEFPDIGPRLKSGLKYYKSHRREQIMTIFKSIPIFEGFTEEELKIIIDDYTEEVFIDPNKIILRPKDKTNAIYFIFLGHINCYADNEDTKEYLIQLKKTGQTDKLAVIAPDEEEELNDLDDDILDLEKDKLSMEDQKQKLKLIKAYTYGGYFGNLDLMQNETRNEFFYVSDSGCQLGAITQELLEELAEDLPKLFDKLKDNIIRCSPKKSMKAIEEEESIASVSMRTSFAAKHVHGRQKRNSSGKIEVPKQVTIHHHVAPPSSNFEQEFVSFKTQFGKLQGDVDSLKVTLIDISTKLSKLVSQNEAKGSFDNVMSFRPERKHLQLKVDCRKQGQLESIPHESKIESIPYLGEVYPDSEESS